MRYRILWDRQWYTLLLICLPILNYIWKYNEPAAYVYLSENSVTINYINLKIMSLAYSILTGTYLFTTFLAAIFNVLAFIKFYFRKQAASSVQVKERNLLFMSIVAMITQLIRTTYNIQRMCFPDDNGMSMFFNNAYPFLCDIFALSGSLSLFVLSATIRKEYKLVYFCYNRSQIIIISSQKSQTKIQLTKIRT
uniref:Serpentine receptor class gamma n=1 Tax=Panagrolaimus davidi TaxID=227884 RepID=A0A914QA47_9BILA